MVKNEGLPMEK